MEVRRTALAITALAITLAGCASRTVGSSGSPTDSVPASLQPTVAVSAMSDSGSVAPLVLASPAAPSPDTEQARMAEAADIADGLPELVMLPTGATRVASPPAPAFTVAPESEETDRIAVAHIFYTVPGTVDSVLTFVQTHLPAGFASNGGGSGGPPPMAYVNLYGTATLAFQAPWITVSAIPDGGLIGVRVDAQVIWLPVRTAGEVIPTTVQSATLMLTGYGHAVTKKTVTVDATWAQALAATVNALPTASDAAHGCPAVSSETTVTFASTPKIVVTESDCGTWLDAGGATQLPLADSGVLQDALNRLLGLPRVDPQSSAPPPPSGPTSGPSIMHFLCTPPGWSPLTATPEELQEYGYPPRPGAGHDQAWVQAMKAAGTPNTCPVAASSN
jgi:hypothetical protein